MKFWLRPSLPAPHTLIGIGVLLVLSALGLQFWVPHLRTSQLVSDIKDLGGHASTRPGIGPEWLIRLVGPEFLPETHEVTYVVLANSAVQDDWLLRLSKVKTLEGLTLNGTHVSDSGLSHLRELKHLRELVLINCPEISQKATAELQHFSPALRVQRRGPALLGVGGADGQESCAIVEIQTGSAAEKAGLRMNDIIRKFDGLAVANFQELVRLVGLKQPGERVYIELERGSERVVAEAVLDAWR